jgi:hypothetical protein
MKNTGTEHRHRTPAQNTSLDGKAPHSYVGFSF